MMSQKIESLASTIINPDDLNYITPEARRIYERYHNKRPYYMQITRRVRSYYGSIYECRPLYLGETQDGVDEWIKLWKAGYDGE